MSARDAELTYSASPRVKTRSVCGLTGKNAAVAPRIVVEKKHRPWVVISPPAGSQLSTLTVWWHARLNVFASIALQSA